jgi:hypothetical protein
MLLNKWGGVSFNAEKFNVLIVREESLHRFAGRKSRDTDT